MASLFPEMTAGSIGDWFAFAAGLGIGFAILTPAAKSVEDAIRKKTA